MDIGEAGRHSDGGVLSNSDFGEALEERSLSIPNHCHLQGMFVINLICHSILSHS